MKERWFRKKQIVPVTNVHTLCLKISSTSPIAPKANPKATHQILGCQKANIKLKKATQKGFTIFRGNSHSKKAKKSSNAVETRKKAKKA